MKLKQVLKNIYSILAGTVVSLLCISILQPFIEKNLIDFLDDKLLFDSITSKTIFLLSVIILVIPYSLKLFTRKSVQKKVWSVSSIMLLTYLFYRFVIPHPSWIFTAWHDSLTYFDLLYIFPLLYLFHALFIRLERPSEKLEEFFVIKKEKGNNKNDEKTKGLASSNISDTAISKPSDDKFNYNLHALDLLKKITEGQEYYKDRAYNIGLLGKWGQGKTSFLNLMKYAVIDNSESQYYHRAIIVDFNPWFSSSKEQIMVDFMREIKITLSPYNPDINHNIEQYVEVLSQVDLGWFSKLAQIFQSQESESIQSRFKLLNESIAAIKKPIIVFMDDTDRLLSDEIFAVLQLIRNTANFKNTVFVVSYDKSYITSALKNGNVISPDEYLEKIFTLSYNLPIVTNDSLGAYNKKVIKEALLIESNSNECQFVDLFIEDIEDSLSVRKAKCLAQNVLFTGSLLMKENERAFCLYDLLLIEYLKMINIQLYSHLSQAPEDLLSKSVFNQELSFNKKIKKYGQDMFNSDDDFINDRIMPYSGGDNALALKSFHILQLLFDAPKDTNAHKYRHEYRLKSSYVYSNYFIRTLPENIILKSDFEKARNGSKIELKDFLARRITPENQLALGYMLENVNFKNEEDGLNILNASCEIMRDRYMPESRDSKILVLPGGSIFGKLYKSDGVINDKNLAELHWKILSIFFKDVSYDSNFEKRFSILCLCDESGIITRQKELFKISTEINFSELYIEYLNVYLKNKTDCQNFNDEFLWRLKKAVISEYRIMAISSLKSFFSNHLRSFITELYSPQLDSHGIIYLFEIDYNDQISKQNDVASKYITYLNEQPEEIRNADWFLEHIKKAEEQLKGVKK